jgi:hypothetical protein
MRVRYGIMRRLPLMAMWLVPCLWPLVGQGDDGLAPGVDVQSMYAELFGHEERAVTATSDVADDIDLAKRVLQATRQLTGPRALRLHLCEQAYRLTAHRNEGMDVAIEAMQLVGQIAPLQQGAAQSRIVDLYTLAMRRGRATDRREAAAMLIAVSLRFGDQQFAKRQYEDAVSLYQRGLQVARSTRSEMREALELRVTCAGQLRAAQEEIHRLVVQLPTAANPRALNTELARAYITSMGDIDSAGWYAQTADDEELAHLVSLARQGAQGAEHREVADWLVAIADRASGYARAQLLNHAIRHYTAYLRIDELDEVNRLLAETRRATARRQHNAIELPHFRGH